MSWSQYTIRTAQLPRLSPFAVATASTAIGCVALAQTPAAIMHEAMFNVHAYGATGDGKSVDTPAFNRAIEAAAVDVAAHWSFLLEPIFASPVGCVAMWNCSYHAVA